MPTHNGTFSVDIDQTKVSPVEISITIGMKTIQLQLSRIDASSFSHFLSVSNTPNYPASYPSSVLPSLIIQTQKYTYEIKWLSSGEIDIVNLMIPNRRHFKIETGLANLLSEEIAAKLGTTKSNSITPTVHSLAHPIPPTPTQIRFNVSTGSDKNFPIQVDLFGDKRTLGFLITESNAKAIAEMLKNRKPRSMSFCDRTGNGWEIHWNTPHKVEFQIVYKYGSSSTLTGDDIFAGRLAEQLLSTMQVQTVLVNTKQIPIYMDPKDLEEIRIWKDPDFEKEMRKRTDKELGRLLGF